MNPTLENSLERIDCLERSSKSLRDRIAELELVLKETVNVLECVESRIFSKYSPKTMIDEINAVLVKDHT